MLKSSGSFMDCSSKEAILMNYYLFSQKLGRESGFGLALIRRPSYILEMRCVSGSAVFVFCFPKTYTHIPKVSLNRCTGLIKCLQLHSSPSVASAEIISYQFTGNKRDRSFYLTSGRVSTSHDTWQVDRTVLVKVNISIKARRTPVI